MIKFEIDPRSSVRYNPSREQIFTRCVCFSTIMIKKYAWAAMHLRHNNSGRSIYHKSTLVGHNGDIPHINLLFFNISYGTNACLIINIPNY